MSFIIIIVIICFLYYRKSKKREQEDEMWRALHKDLQENKKERERLLNSYKIDDD